MHAHIHYYHIVPFAHPLVKVQGTQQVSSYTPAFSCPPILKNIFILSNTCFFKSARLTFWPIKPPNVASNSNGFNAFQISWTLLGGSGIILGYDHIKLNAVVLGSLFAWSAL